MPQVRRNSVKWKCSFDLPTGGKLDVNVALLRRIRYRKNEVKNPHGYGYRSVHFLRRLNCSPSTRNNVFTNSVDSSRSRTPLAPVYTNEKQLILSAISLFTREPPALFREFLRKKKKKEIKRKISVRNKTANNEWSRCDPLDPKNTHPPHAGIDRRSVETT